MRLTVMCEIPLAPAIGTDASDLVPLDNLDALAAAGLHGLFAPPDVGGFDAEFPTICDTVEQVASGRGGIVSPAQTAAAPLL